MTFKEFENLASAYNVIPVWKTLLADTLTPVSLYLLLREQSTSTFLFESVEGGEHFGRYSFIGIHPRMMIRCYGNETTITTKDGSVTSSESVFDILVKLITRYRQPVIPDLPRCTGGLVGFLGYDSVRSLEHLPSRIDDSLRLNDSMFGLFDTIIAFDHLKHELILVTNAVLESADELHTHYTQALERLSALEDVINSAGRRNGHSFKRLDPPPLSEMSKEHYEALVRRSKELILDGDIFQVVISQRFSMSFEGDTFNVYRALRVINPSPYLYYLDFEGFEIIGSSPEILVRMENGIAEVYPIAGTRPRGKSTEEDKRLEENLRSDEKERAEHVMLVDLGRNDLGRVCEAGSVKVNDFMNPVRYSHVMHLASRITGKVLPSLNCIDVLKATFPAGTVSGAPKIRAMEIIDELEPSRRGIYAGGVGYIDFSGRMDICIAIRTLFAQNGTIYFQAGAGIVADSDPSSEFRETMSKAQVLVDALSMAEKISS